MCKHGYDITCVLIGYSFQMCDLIGWSISIKKCINSIFLLGSWRNSLQYCKPSTASRVCIIVSNSPNSLCAWTRQCAHGKSPLLLNCVITVITVEPAGKASLFYSYTRTRVMGHYNGKWRISFIYVSDSAWR